AGASRHEIGRLSVWASTAGPGETVPAAGNLPRPARLARPAEMSGSLVARFLAGCSSGLGQLAGRGQADRGGRVRPRRAALPFPRATIGPSWPDLAPAPGVVRTVGPGLPEPVSGLA